MKKQLEEVKKISTTDKKRDNDNNVDVQSYLSKVRSTGERKAKVVKMSTEEVIVDMKDAIFEMKKMSLADYSKLSKKERDKMRNTHEVAAKKKAAYGSKKKEAAKKPAPEPKPEKPPTVGELLLKHHKSGSIHMGTVRSTSQKLPPIYRGQFQHWLAYNDHQHAGFKADPEGTAKSWLRGHLANKQSNPRTTPSLGGGKFSKLGK